MRGVIRTEREAVNTDYWGNVILVLPHEAKTIGLGRFLKKYEKTPGMMGFIYVGSCRNPGGCNSHQETNHDGNSISSPGKMLMESDKEGNPV